MVYLLEKLLGDIGYMESFNSITFQSTMNHIFQEYLRGFVLVLFEYIMVYNGTWEENIGTLDTILGILEQ